MLYSELIPNNQGIIFRKEYTDLRDSTIKDFQLYTGLQVNSTREVKLPNGSLIMFRHIEELHNIQNVNLGWFGIEQGDELDSDNEFFLLFGRLRRKITPSKQFVDLGLPEQTGFVIANAGDHWMKNLWLNKKLEDADLVEACTLDNADVLSEGFLKSLDTVKKNKPEIYNQFVKNDWSVNADQFILIKPTMVEALKDAKFWNEYHRKIVTCDPATGGDECVVYAMDNDEVVDERILHVNDTMKIAGENVILAQQHGIEDYAVDAIGVGKGIGDRLNEMGKRVNLVISSEKASDSERFNNLRTEMWWYCMEQIQNRKIPYPKDEELRRQLSSVRYKVVNSNGKIQLEPKDETKKRLKRSPDRADAFVYGVWAGKDLRGDSEGIVSVNFDKHFAGGRAGY